MVFSFEMNTLKDGLSAHRAINLLRVRGFSFVNKERSTGTRITLF